MSDAVPDQIGKNVRRLWLAYTELQGGDFYMLQLISVMSVNSSKDVGFL